MAEYILNQVASEVQTALDKALTSVQTINGNQPDETGNLVIETGTVSAEQIASAVEAYLAEHPIVGGSTVRVDNIELLATNWVGDSSPYSQIVTISGITPYSQVDLTPSVEQLTIFHDKDLAFVTENEDGVVTVYAIGDKPLNDYTMQVTIKEVSV